MIKNKKRDKESLSTLKRQRYGSDSKTIKFYRRNPIIACEDLLGIKLMDSQKYILQSSWNAGHVVWCCSRNFGKSFLGAIFMILKAVLFENQGIYIVSSVGDQAKETFDRIEQIVRRIGQIASSNPSLKDIIIHETVKSPSCKTGFTHAQGGFEVNFYNGSFIATLNSKPDNTRSRRSSLVFFDEAGFSSEELIIAVEAFATQERNFATSTENDFNINTKRKKCPTQLIYASSASDVDTIFFRKYKDFAMQMFLGDTNYFCVDIPCTIPLKPMVDGEWYAPLLQQQKVDSAIRANKLKAEREYYNKFLSDTSEEQIIKWGMVRRNETFVKPILYNTTGDKFIFAFDPARINDNSIVMGMKLCNGDNGLYGEVCYCKNLIDKNSKNNLKLSSPEQIKKLQQIILDFNGDGADYEYLDMLLIDAGSGGGGVSSIGDNLLEPWYDKKGVKHKGFLDLKYEVYEGFQNRYRDNVNNISFISPKKYRTQMVEELMELMRFDLIKFPKEYNGKDTVITTDDDGNVIKESTLSYDERLSLIELDLMKAEITAIERRTNSENTRVSYELSKTSSVKHDDRFYTLILLAHRLYELRREQGIRPSQGASMKELEDWIMTF